MPHSVFISYAHEDRPTADRLCEWIERDTAACWMAPRDILPGSEYGAAIVQAIKSSRIVLLVFSASADASPHVSRELTIAVSNNIPVLPFCIDATQPSGHMEYVLATPHRLVASGGAFEANARSLQSTLASILQPSAGTDEVASRVAPSRHAGDTASDRREIPELVPYLVDRRDQDLQIQGLFHSAWKKGASQPLACFIYGEETECIDSFVDRIHGITLPQLTKRCQRGDRVRRIDLAWPHRPAPTTVRLQRLRDELADRFELPPKAPAAEILGSVISGRSDILTIVYNVHSQHWQDNEQELIESWLRFWSEVCPLPDQQSVFVMVNLHFQAPSGMLDRWREQRRRGRILDFLRTLQASMNAEASPLIVDELTPVGPGDVEDWARVHGRQHCHVRDIDTLLQEVRGIFSRGRGGIEALPMRTVANELRKLVEQPRR